MKRLAKHERRQIEWEARQERERINRERKEFAIIGLVVASFFAFIF